jgi:hypothetical protein
MPNKAFKAKNVPALAAEERKRQYEGLVRIRTIGAAAISAAVGWIGGRDRFDLEMAGGYLHPNNVFSDPANRAPLEHSYTTNGSSVVGGAEVGCDWQAPGSGNSYPASRRKTQDCGSRMPPSPWPRAKGAKKKKIKNLKGNKLESWAARRRPVQ